MRTISMALALALFAAPAVAQSPQQQAWCHGSTATDEQTIEGCTALINSGRETPTSLAIDFHDRSIGYLDKGELDQVIADDTQAIELKPDYVDSYNGRGG